MKKYSTKEVEAYILELYEKVKPQAELSEIYKPLSVYFEPVTKHNREGSYCYADYKGYHSSTMERGKICDNVTTDLSEITYGIIENNIFNIAVNYERMHRVEGQDNRRLLFEKFLELLKLVGEEYANRYILEIEEVLKEAPFNDGLPEKID